MSDVDNIVQDIVHSESIEERRKKIEEATGRVRRSDKYLNTQKGVARYMIDMVGHMSRSKSLLVVADSGRRNANGEVLWRCVCACGREFFESTNKLRRGKQTCGKCKKVERSKIDRERYRTVIRNHGRRSLEDLSESDKYTILKLFLDGATTNEIESSWNIKLHSLRAHFADIKDRMTIGLELERKMNMIHNSPSPPEEINVDELIQNIITKSTTSDLDKLLSPPTSKDLTANELTFSYLFAATNNIYTALEGSSFLSTLREQKGTAYIHTLGTFLLNKPNIKGMINKFLLDQTTQEEVTKDLVQNELVTQIFQLKEKLKYDVSSRGADRGYLLKAIEMLGKSVGAFSERLTIEQVDPGQALDKLIECAKRETSQGSYTIIDEEIVDDNGE